MAKKVLAIIKLQIKAGQATPAPPVGPALGQHGANIMQFVKEYNERTASQSGTVVPVQITVYQDHSFTFVTKTSPASELIKQHAGLSKGSDNPLRNKVGELNRETLRKIAETKLRDLNASDVDAAMRIIEGTARSMGITVAD